MNHSSTERNLSTIGLAAILALMMCPSVAVADSHAESPPPVMSDSSEGFSPWVDSSGAITRPEVSRSNWTHLGTWFVKEEAGARGPGVHDVYAEPTAVKAFLETGEWPDGAALVKEIRSIESRPMTTGQASWGGDVGVWFVMIKDRTNRFPTNPIWGEGWGWALYKSDDPDKNVNQDWKKGDLSNCFGCHIPAKKTDWVFLEGYPEIRGQ